MKTFTLPLSLFTGMLGLLGMLGFVGIIGSTLFLASCNSTTKNSDGEVQDSSRLADTVGGIGVNPLSHAQEFPGASLGVVSITAELQGSDSARMTINYQVDNFNLTEQTAHDHDMANSAEGQHIHFILDKEPYVALYAPRHSFTVALDREYSLLSFLSRSFHESIKTDEAYEWLRFRVDRQGEVEQLDLPQGPALFYSRPQAEYSGEDTRAVLLDFFLVNTVLSADNHQVRALINDQEFILQQWTPYEILNLPAGENTVQLTLLDENGQALEGDHVSVDRTIRLVTF